MERQDIMEALSELKLYGMRASFDEIAGKGLVRRDEIYPLLASLIRAERVHRQAKSISYRMRCAKFPVLKDIDKFVFADTPVDEGQVRELATGAFIDGKRNAIFIGGTGSGKTHLCIGVAAAVIPMPMTGIGPKKSWLSLKIFSPWTIWRRESSFGNLSSVRRSAAIARNVDDGTADK